MDSSLLTTGAGSLLLWIAGLPLLWGLIRGTQAKPARVTGLKADFLMLIHLALLLLGIGILFLATGW
jgi:hypothetical protein